MLTIQPTSITHSAKPMAFRGDFDETAYNNRKDYYAHQKEECDEILENQYVPKTMKTGVKVCKAISEGVLSGWAVAWAALKVSKFGKASAIKISNNKFLNKGIEALAPMKDGIVKTAKNIKDKIVDSKVANAIKTKAGQFIKMSDEDLAKHKLGRFALKHEKAFHKITSGVSEIASAVKEKISGIAKAITYDKTAKAIAYTLGVGSGIASAYNSVRQDFAPNNEGVDEEWQ